MIVILNIERVIMIAAFSKRARYSAYLMRKALSGIIWRASLIGGSRLFRYHKCLLEFRVINLKHPISRDVLNLKILSLDDFKLMLVHSKTVRHLLRSYCFDSVVELFRQIYWWGIYLRRLHRWLASNTLVVCIYHKTSWAWIKVGVHWVVLRVVRLFISWKIWILQISWEARRRLSLFKEIELPSI